MSYNEAIEQLYAIAPPFHQVGAVAYKPGLDTMRSMMQKLGNPHKNMPVIHVAGTNGKGSTSHLIAAALAAAGWKVGLYTSPHLVDFTERVRVIDGSRIKAADSHGMKTDYLRFIPQKYVAEFVERNRSIFSELQPSFFEITTAMAFCWLHEQQVDIAVIEVGLGGLLDATNIVEPLLSLITNIGFDHTDLLGHTLAEIAGQKAGIMKPGVPCVIGETHSETKPVFLQKAAECGILGEGLETTDCRIWFADECGFLRKQRLRVAPDCELKGAYQQKNLQTAYVALQVLRNYAGERIRKENCVLSQQSIAEGFARVVQLTGLRGRWEIVSANPLTICDTGHNSHGVATYIEQLIQLGKPLHIVFGMVADKDILEVLKLLPVEARYYFTQPAGKRALPAEELQTMWQTVHPEAENCWTFTNVQSAVEEAKRNAKPEDVIFIGGSNYVVGEALRLIR